MKIRPGDLIFVRINPDDWYSGSKKHEVGLAITFPYKVPNAGTVIGVLVNGKFMNVLRENVAVFHKRLEGGV